MNRVWLLLALALAPPKLALAPVDQAGYQKLIHAHARKVLLVDFWATWCEPCREEMPGLVKLAAANRPRGLDFIAISADLDKDLPKAEQFLRSIHAPLPSYYKHTTNDDDFINSIDHDWSGALPALFLYGRDGKLARKFIGETDTAALEAAIRKALAQPVSRSDR